MKIEFRKYEFRVKNNAKITRKFWLIVARVQIYVSNSTRDSSLVGIACQS